MGVPEPEGKDTTKAFPEQETKVEKLMEMPADIFIEPLTADEVAGLEQDQGEDNLAYVRRTEQFIKSQKNNLKVDSNDGAVSDDGSDGTNDQDLGCTAFRHDLPEMQSLFDWQIYVITQSAAMKKRGETFDTTPVSDDEPFESYLCRITADENLRLSIFRRIESDKAVKREFQALGMLIYPPSFQNTTAKTSLETSQYLLRLEDSGNITYLNSTKRSRPPEMGMVQQSFCKIWGQWMMPNKLVSRY
jgi:hypothetical protein